jgi:iron complex transport system substrate-binding protein
MAEQRALAEMVRRPGWSQLRALAAGRACGFEPSRYELLIRPGPRLGEAALQMADCLAGLEPR